MLPIFLVCMNFNRQGHLFQPFPVKIYKIIMLIPCERGYYTEQCKKIGTKEYGISNKDSKLLLILHLLFQSWDLEHYFNIGVLCRLFGVVSVHSCLIMQSTVRMISPVTEGTSPVGLLVEATIPEHFIPATYKSFYRLTHLPNPIIFYQPVMILLYFTLHHTTISRRKQICLKSYKLNTGYHTSMGQTKQLYGQHNTCQTL